MHKKYDVVGGGDRRKSGGTSLSSVMPKVEENLVSMLRQRCMWMHPPLHFSCPPPSVIPSVRLFDTTGPAQASTGGRHNNVQDHLERLEKSVWNYSKIHCTYFNIRQ